MFLLAFFKKKSETLMEPEPSGVEIERHCCERAAKSRSY